MKIFKLSPRILALSAALAAISAVVQLVHIGYQSPTWGMWIDLVAVTWIIAFFLFGLRSSIAVSITGALIITIFDPSTWLGASMKFIATAPLYLSLYLYLRLYKKKLQYYDKPFHLLIPTFIGLIIRSLIVLPLNYFYAIPIWTGMDPIKAIAAIPWFVIVGFNIVQGILDISLAWILVFRFRLSRYADWNNE
uniref:ECF transporter S component n=1 Tax=candidate division CPR3 bacterium TaxID=2268181 RepID=A0A7C4M0J4_UNCC3